ncbi:hypothetical protein V6N13_128849 [Hibiscus sabdariffa]
MGMECPNSFFKCIQSPSKPTSLSCSVADPDRSSPATAHETHSIAYSTVLDINLMAEAAFSSRDFDNSEKRSSR